MDSKHEIGMKFTSRYKLFHTKKSAFYDTFEQTTKVSICLISNLEKRPFSPCIRTYSTVVGPSKKLRSPILSELRATRNK